MFGPRLPELVWNVFSVFPVVGGTIRFGKLRLTASALLMATSVYNTYMTQDVVCALEGNCDHTLATIIKGMFIRAVAGTCLISRLTMALRGDEALKRYTRNVDRFHALAPPTRAETVAAGRLSCLLVVCCLLLTVPVNGFRLWLLFFHIDFTVLTFLFMYVQNISMYCIETHFAVLCYGLYQKFAGINADLTTLRVDTVVRNRYPLLMALASADMRGDDSDRRTAGRGGGRIVQAAASGRPTAAAVELLKIKHKIAREAAISLNDEFGVYVGLSMCALCLYTMFDLYYYLVGIMNPTKTVLLIYGWIAQYAFRFGSVMVLAYLTTQQALKTKVLITDINNRNLDKDAKEELQIFFSQICNCPMDFTACDYFTLDTHLITSAIASITTYLVILLQFNATRS